MNAITAQIPQQTPRLALVDAPTHPAPAVELVIPVYNEEHVLATSVHKLHAYMTREFTFAFQITIANNASTDRTLAVARSLAAELPEVAVLHLERKGRGRALRAAWASSRAEVVGYMDVDLSTDLSALPALLEPLLAGRGDITIGSRLARGAQVTRGLKRELISRSYNLLLRAFLGVVFSDAQCGFKAARREAIEPLLADVQDDAWFFDTELLHLAQRSKLSIREVPVRWVEDPDSRVQIFATALADLRGIARLRATAKADSAAGALAPDTLRSRRGRAHPREGSPSRRRSGFRTPPSAPA